MMDFRPLTFAQVAIPAIGYYAKVLIVIAAVVGIVLVTLHWMGITIPQPVMRILGIVALAVFVLVMLDVLLGFL